VFEAFQQNVLTHVRGAGHILADSWRFLPLCTDTAGGWDAEAIKTLNKCASRIDVSRRGHVVGLWWQMLPVAVQKEQARVLSWKAGACAGLPTPPGVTHEDVFSFDSVPFGLF